MYKSLQHLIHTGAEKVKSLYVGSFIKGKINFFLHCSLFACGTTNWFSKCDIQCREMGVNTHICDGYGDQILNKHKNQLTNHHICEILVTINSSLTKGLFMQLRLQSY